MTAKTFLWLAEEIEAKGITCPRSLVYVKDYQWCGEIFNFFMQTLGVKLYSPMQSGKKKKSLPCTTVEQHQECLIPIERSLWKNIFNGKTLYIILFRNFLYDFNFLLILCCLYFSC